MGAQYHDGQQFDCGAVYVYQRSAGTWTLQAELAPPTPTAGALFGWPVSLDGNRLLVGARGTNSYTGRAYVFVQTGGVWSFEAQLDAPDAATQDNFGLALCLRGTTAVIGAPGDDLVSSNEGSAYVFERGSGGWAFSTKLTASDATDLDAFGWNIALSGNTLAIGAWNAGPSPSYQPGAVYLFDRSGGPWVQTDKLQPTSLTAFSIFGASVALQPDRLVVGASSAGNYNGSGAVYFYQRLGGTWIARQRIWIQGSSGHQNFGEQVSLDGDHLIVGAPADGGSPVNQGTVHVYRLTDDIDALCFGDGTGTPCPCSNTTVGFGVGCRNSIGRGGRLLAQGDPSVGTDTLVLSGSDMPQGSALYFQALAAVNFGTGTMLMDGLLCVSGSPIRLGVESVPGQGLCAYPDLATQQPVSIRGAVQPGDVRYYQIYYRDNSTFCTSATANFSNALRIVWQP